VDCRSRFPRARGRSSSSSPRPPSPQVHPLPGLSPRKNARLAPPACVRPHSSSKPPRETALHPPIRTTALPKPTTTTTTGRRPPPLSGVPGPGAPHTHLIPRLNSPVQKQLTCSSFFFLSAPGPIHTKTCFSFCVPDARVLFCLPLPPLPRAVFLPSLEPQALFFGSPVCKS
jgi:hypothetical protein